MNAPTFLQRAFHQHQQRVLSVYKGLLKVARKRSSPGNGYEFKRRRYINLNVPMKRLLEMNMVRNEFKKHMHERDPARIEELVDDAERALLNLRLNNQRTKIWPYQPGGPMYQRNAPFEDVFAADDNVFRAP